MRQSESEGERRKEKERGRREKAIIGSSHKNFVSFVFLFSALYLPLSLSFFLHFSQNEFEAKGVEIDEDR